MKIGVDISTVKEGMAGIGQYTYELLKELVKLDSQNKYLFYTNQKNKFHKELKQDNSQIIEILFNNPGFKWIYKTSKKVKKDNIDLFISPSLFTFGILIPNTYQVVHDVIPLKNPEYWPKKASFMFKAQLGIETKRAAKFLTNSDTTKSNFVEFYPSTNKKTFKIGTGLNEWTKSLASSGEIKEAAKKFDLPEKYILSTSTLQPRKNYKNMILAFKKSGLIEKGYKYLIVGKKGWFFEEIFKIVEDENLQSSVRFLGYVEEEYLRALYFNAKAFLYCSFDEGFGMPAIESYSQRTPVICSNIEVLKETMMENATYVDPNSVKDITKGINITVNSEFEFDEDFLERYSWSKVAQELVGLYGR